MKEKRFCKCCGQRLPEGMALLFGKVKIHEFTDGFYCDNCAKIRVQRCRSLKQ